VLALVAAVWQSQIADYMGTVPPTVLGYSRTIVLSAVIGLVILATARGVTSRWSPGC
jgi:hypothetical protein